MQALHVCSLARVAQTVRATGAGSLITLIHPPEVLVRPATIAPDRHLTLSVSDITEAMQGHMLPAESHVETLIAFFRSWDRRQPMVVHCYAGVSRSTAAAFIGACALAPDRREAEIAAEIRAASPTASPNARLVELGDRLLGREGRMIEAVNAIGRGADCFEGIPFALELD